MATQAKVGQELCFVDRQLALDRFDLDDDSVADEDVQPIAGIEHDAFVLHGEREPL